MNYFGNKGEDFIKSLFEKSGIKCEKMPGKFIEYDFECKLGRKKFTVEVKYDWMAQKTGNVAIEYLNTKSDTPSGINATTSDLWITLIEDGSNLTAWVTQTEKLKDFFNKTEGRKVNGGDNNSAMKLFKQEQIFAFSTRIDDVEDSKDLVKRIKKIL